MSLTYTSSPRRKGWEKLTFIEPMFKEAIWKYAIALDFFFYEIDHFSPVGIFPVENANTSEISYVLDADNQLPQDPSTLKEINSGTIEDLKRYGIYEDPRRVEMMLENSRILGKGVQGTVYNMTIDDGVRMIECVMKKAPIVPIHIYTKYILLNEWKNTKNPIVRTQLSIALRRAHQDEVYNFRRFRVPLDNHDLDNEDTVSLLLALYRRMCVEEVLSNNSDSNVDVLVSWLCSDLVLERRTPAFPLLYASFKTDDPLSSKNGLYPEGFDESVLGSFRYDVTKYTYPHQYMAIEKLDFTLYELLRSPMFKMGDVPLQVLCRRYMSVIGQLVLALFTAQKSINYTSNDLHSQNVMVSEYVGDIYYSVNLDDLPNLREIFPKKLFKTDAHGNIVLIIDTDFGICKIIDQGRANVDVDGVKVGSRTTNFVAEQYGIYDYDPLDPNNDLLRILVEIYDNEFVTHLIERQRQNLSTPTEANLLKLFRQAFQCKRNEQGVIESLFKVRKDQCKNKAICNQSFDYFNKFGFGTGDMVCTITDKTTPDSLMPYLSMYNCNNCNKEDLKLCYSMITGK